jgi:dihydrofolate synthase / folylpolyglutamate synthase
MNYNETVKYLCSLQRFGSRPGLTRIKDVLQKLECKKLDSKVIHVAGTNGKGSTVAMIAQILKEAGYSVGVFISPYIVDFRERVQINGEYIPENEIVKITEKVVSKKVFLTFFEIMTAIAIKYFNEQKVDYIVLETGLGGRLDATNAIHSDIQAITSIELDHMEVLGDSIESIAREKAAIIEEESSVFIPNGCNAREIIENQCKKCNAELMIAKEVESEIKLKGKHQKRNAGIAVAISRHLGIREDIIQKGLNETVWPGRLEVFGNVMLDCAHNCAAIKELRDYIDSLNHKNITIVFGVLKDKDYKSMIDLFPKYNKFIFTRPPNDRALKPFMLNDRCVIIENPKEALEYAIKNTKKDELVLVTGSCYLVSVVRPLLLL